MSDELPPSLVISDLGIEWNHGKYDAVELREPKAKELVKALSVMKGNADTQSLVKFQIALICAVTELPEQVVEQMPISKLNEAFTYLQGFTSAGSLTGVT